MKKFKILLFLPVVLLLCGCNSKKEYSQIEQQLYESRLKVVDVAIKDNIVTSYNCPNVFISPRHWQAFYLLEKESIGKSFATKCEKAVFLKDSYNGKKLMKCTSEKCKIYN